MRKIKTEHNGAKNGMGYWGKRTEAKKMSNKLRRVCARKCVALASESSLKKDWLWPQENEAWQNL